MNTMDTFRFANASKLTDRLWIGGDLEVFDPDLAWDQLDELVAAGLTDIVDLRLEWDDSSWVTDQEPDLHYLWLGVDDAGQKMPDEWFDNGTAHILKRLDAGAKVLTHCHMGINRGPSMGYAVLLALGWDPIDALDLIRARRPIAHVGYAEDALDWWLRKNAASRTERADGRRSIRQWRRDNYLDIATVIRGIRLKEGA